MIKNRISVIGTGYVGLVSGVCLGDFGNYIINADIDQEKIHELNNGIIPIYEPGLKEIYDRVVSQGRIIFTTDIKHAVENSKIIFIAVGTPPREDGSADLKHVLEVARSIACYMNESKVIVTKSTVPVGTGQLLTEIIEQELKRLDKEHSFEVVSNPEFLREGKAVYDFTHPDRIVIGTRSEEVKKLMQEVYRPLYLNNTPFLFTSTETAELIKYASNAFLATKISFINEISRLCEKLNANVKDVARGMGMDGRISPKFLHAGAGFGGSCFPKDTRALVSLAEANGLNMSIVQAAINTNEKQKLHMVDKVVEKMGDLTGKTIGVLGLSFKPETDDMREAPALTVLPELIKRGATIKAFDPEGIKEATWRLEEYKDHITYCGDEYEVMDGSHALVILTEWNQFRKLDLERMKNLLVAPYFFDFRNIYNREEAQEAGLIYTGVGMAEESLEEVNYLWQIYKDAAVTLDSGE